MTQTPVLLAMVPLAVFSTASFYTQFTRTDLTVGTPHIKVVSADRVTRVPVDNATFNDRWADIMFVKYVTTTSIVKPVVEAKAEVLAPRPEPVVRKRDICARHGMRKVRIGRRWRCR